MAIQFGSQEARSVVEADTRLRRECRTQIQAIASCPRCGAVIELVAETDEWVKRGMLWIHNSYGPAQGVCEACNVLIVDSWDGCHAYQLGA